MRVLITGASGYVGGRLVRGLGADFDLRLGDRTVPDADPRRWVASDAPPRPVGTYAVTKQLAEVLCEQYARSFGLSVVCLRIPKPIDPDDPNWRGRRIRPQWLAFADLVNAYRLALRAPG